MITSRLGVAAIAGLFSIALAGTAHAQIGADTQANAAVLAATKQIMAAARYATLVTIGHDGQAQARIVDAFDPEPDITVWIGTNKHTRKVADIQRDPRVTLLYFNPAGSEYVTILGVAALVADSVERVRRWKPEWGQLYSAGPLSDEYLLIRVRPKRLEASSFQRGLLNDPRTWLPVIVEFP